jgi:hypothetical protein
MTTELQQLEMLAEVDELVARLSAWRTGTPVWRPQSFAQALIARLLQRVETLRIRLEAPLVVATFGGTGTGKSALVNALVGADVTPSGRQRPTTTRPVVIVHPQVDPALLGLPLHEVDIVRHESPVVRDIVIIDCPDPDTSEQETAGSNLARLHRLLPYCDVLLYVSTQQKYRNSRVVDELAQAAAGCRLVFVQTNADLDEDIRDDWRRQLTGQYEVPEMFFVDSVSALRDQQSGTRPRGEFGRLLDLLASQLTASHRTQIRRANLLDLVHDVLQRIRQRYGAGAPAVKKLEAELAAQRNRLIESMSTKLKDELMSSRHLWERRTLAAVVDGWGISPFSLLLRTYHGLGALITAGGLWRARSTVQMALIGAVHGVQWIRSKAEEMQADTRLDRAGSLGLDDGLLRESQLVITGYARDAQFDPGLVNAGAIESLRSEAARVEGEFLGGASREIDSIVADVAARRAGLGIRIVYEALFLAMAAYVIGYPAYNFFYAYPVAQARLTPSDFYVHGAVFTTIWAIVLVMSFVSRLRLGLSRNVSELADRLARGRLASGLFPQLEQACRDVSRQSDELESLAATTQQLRRQLSGAERLGAARLRQPDPVG